VQYFSRQVAMNKCFTFTLNPERKKEKKLSQIRAVVLEKNVKKTLPQNNVTVLQLTVVYFANQRKVLHNL